MPRESKPKKAKSKMLSVPKFIYISVGIASVAMIISQFFVNCNSSFDMPQILANIGYSLLASDVAGILFDLGNNCSKSKNDKKIYGSITLNHSGLINDIILDSEYTCERLNVPDFQEMLFSEQLKHCLFEGLDNDTIQTEEYIEATEDIYNWLTLVRDTSKELLKISFIMYENKQFNEKERTKLRLLIAVANEAIEQFERHTYDSNKKVYTLINRINKLLVELYPDNAELLIEE